MDMTKPPILLDVDGVICDFVSGIIKSLGPPIEHPEYYTWDHHKEHGITDEEFWAATTTPNWWLNLDPYPWAGDLLKMLREEHTVIFCTSPSLATDCPSQKVGWLRKHGFMSQWRNDYQIGPKKELNAKSGAILIDDSDSNVEKYISAGGFSVTFPQPWNKCAEFSKDPAFDCISYVRSYIEAINILRNRK